MRNGIDVWSVNAVPDPNDVWSVAVADFVISEDEAAAKAAAKKAAQRVRYARWKAAHPGKHNEHANRWYHRNKKQAKAASRKWQRVNPAKAHAIAKRARTKKNKVRDELKAAARAERQKRQEAAVAARLSKKAEAKKARKASKKKWAAAWRKDNPIAARAAWVHWSKKNPLAARLNRQRRRARERNAAGDHTEADIQRILARQKRKCAHPWCRVSLKPGYQIDHVMPLVRGGSNAPQNLQLLCPPCNQRKNASHPIDYALAHGMLV